MRTAASRSEAPSFRKMGETCRLVIADTPRRDAISAVVESLRSSSTSHPRAVQEAVGIDPLGEVAGHAGAQGV